MLIAVKGAELKAKQGLRGWVRPPGRADEITDQEAVVQALLSSCAGSESDSGWQAVEQACLAGRLS